MSIDSSTTVTVASAHAQGLSKESTSILAAPPQDHNIAPSANTITNFFIIIVLSFSGTIYVALLFVFRLTTLLKKPVI
ncbi:MAG: hypothetical protein QNL43_10590 [Crocinitomicaceae bacterium]